MSSDPDVSAGGRYVVFSSEATSLVTGDTNHTSDVFIRDRTKNTTQRVSLRNSGKQANGGSWGASVSSNGRYVVFSSGATNLVTHDTNGIEDVFVRDRVAKTTKRVSVTSSGSQAVGYYANLPAISGNGRFVVFSAAAKNLVKGENQAVSEVFIRDLRTRKTKRVSVAKGGGKPNASSYDAAAISSDGRFVVFDSSASNLVSHDTNSASDVFIRDMKKGTTKRVSVSNGGAQAKGYSYAGDVSDNGRYVTFSSDAKNLVSGDTNGLSDVFVRDISAKTTKRASVNSAGHQANGNSSQPVSSGNGRWVAFESYATSLCAGDYNDCRDVFVRDRVNNKTSRLSVSSAGVEGNDDSDMSYGPAINANGSCVVFGSWATNLVPNDTNDVYDVFLRYRPM